MKDLFDVYDIRSRILPALIVASPIILNMYLLIPTMAEFTTTIMTSIIGIGWLQVIGELARKKGKMKVKKMYEASAISPAARCLRWSDDTINKTSKLRYHKYLESNIEGYKFFTPEEEAAMPQDADTNYKSAIEWLRNNRRDKTKYRIIYEENIHCGFCRNLYGLKGIAIWILLILIVAIFINCIMKNGLTFKGVSLEIYACIILDISVLFLWIKEVNESLIEQSNYSYAKKLLESCDVVS